MKPLMLRSTTLDREVEVLSDGKTCWVNDTADGCALARWSPRGVDIHRTGEEQLRGGVSCLDCTSGSWAYFIEAMRRHYGVELPQHLIAPAHRQEEE